MKWLTVAFVLLLAAISTIASCGLGDEIFGFVRVVPGGDKAGHFLLMGILSLFVNLSLRATRVTILGMRVLTGSLIVLVVVAIEEASQVFIAACSASLSDLFADFLGIFVFGRIAMVFVNRRAASMPAG